MMVPSSMPYTLQDILSCKDITDERVKKDYRNVIKFDGLTNPRKFCGNPTIYKYQLRNPLNCKRDTKGYMTIEEYFTDPEQKEILWKETVHRNMRDISATPSPTDIYECHRINKGAIVPFKASTAKYIYKKYGATSVLDPTAGWGGRLLGATSIGIKYTGYDTNLKMKPGYDEMIKTLELKNCEMRWESSMDQDFQDLEYDMILTSPPYVNMELYECMDPFKSEYEFYNNWLIPLLSNAWEGLDDAGHMFINVSPKMYGNLVKYGFEACDFKENLRQQLGKQYKTKSQDFIYIWKK